MKSSPVYSWRVVMFRLAVCFVATAPISAADFTVTSPSFAFNVNGTNSPTLTLVRGWTYTFDINTICDFHPFRINSPGVVNNNICFGLITYTVPTNQANYYYDCGEHGQTSRGEILTVEPAVVVRIVGFDFTPTTLVLRSTGTNNFSIFPEYKNDLNMTNWLALTVQTNRFLNGTNETIVTRPPGSNVFIRLREVAN